MKFFGIFRKRNTDGDPECGQAIVEFALALPVLLLILCGILDFGWIYVNSYRVEHAAYAGARYATIYAAEQGRSELTGNIIAAVAGNLPDGKAEHVSVSISESQKQVTIRVNYPVKTLTFVANTIFGNYYNASLINVACY